MHVLSVFERTVILFFLGTLIAGLATFSHLKMYFCTVSEKNIKINCLFVFGDFFFVCVCLSELFREYTTELIRMHVLCLFTMLGGLKYAWNCLSEKVWPFRKTTKRD